MPAEYLLAAEYSAPATYLAPAEYSVSALYLVPPEMDTFVKKCGDNYLMFAVLGPAGLADPGAQPADQPHCWDSLWPLQPLLTLPCWYLNNSSVPPFHKKYLSLYIHLLKPTPLDTSLSLHIHILTPTSPGNHLSSLPSLWLTPCPALNKLNLSSNPLLSLVSHSPFPHLSLSSGPLLPGQRPPPPLPRPLPHPPARGAPASPAPARGAQPPGHHTWLPTTWNIFLLADWQILYSMWPV